MGAWIGIDPGKDGAIAVLRHTGEIEFHDIGGSIPDAIEFLRKALREALSARACGVVIEHAQAFPKQGASSGFNYGACWGALRAICLTLGMTILAEPYPRVWKAKIFACKLPKDRAVQKRMARDKARELYPQAAEFLSRVKDADRAEALLLAHYGRLLFGGQ